MAGPSLMDSLFQRSLEDLIKGLRLHQSSGGESAFLFKSLEEIRREIKATDAQTKTAALQKLTYLHSLHGLDMSWAAFHAVEVTSYPTFSFKKIGYLAASLSFHSSTDVLLLLTNQLRKDLSSTNHFEVSLALECISIICTPDLAIDLTPEIFTLLGSSKQFVKKKAIAAILKVFGQYPDAVRVCFKRLVENLENSDVCIVSSVVGVFCELAMIEPKSYLPLAPEFYRILVDSRNNWVLIKVLKIFAKLAPLEPRLANRVVEPICDHMRKSGAKSLVFECVKTVASSLSEHESAIKLAVSKIREFLIDDDPNLKYLGLQALAIVAPKHLWAVLENKEVVIKSLNDADPNIKLEALRLVMTMMSEDNVTEICRVLINYALKSDPKFCNEILSSVLSTCYLNFYEIVTDFDWYVLLLGEMSRIPHCQKGDEIENQLIDIGMRVKDVRPELVRVSRDLLIDPALLGNPFIHRILCAAAWVSGEYVEYTKNPVEIIEALLQPRTSLLSSSIRAVYIQSVFKVLSFSLHSYLFLEEGVASSSSFPVDLEPIEACSSDQIESVSADRFRGIITADLKKGPFTKESVNDILDLIETSLAPLAGNHDVEVHERVQNVLGFIELVRQEFEKEQSKASEIINLVCDAFSEEVGPVSVSAQERVHLPDGLKLNENLSDLDVICGDIQLPISTSFSLGRSNTGESDVSSLINSQYKEESEPSSESTSLLAEHRKRHGLYYLPSEKKEILSNDYPPANDPNLKNDAEDLVKLTENLLISKKRQNQAKQRPVVVKLEEGEAVPLPAKKPESKDDLISGAVRDVLLGNEAVPSSSSVKSSIKRGKEKLISDHSSELGSSSSRRSKHRSTVHNVGDTGQNVPKEKLKSGHHHGKRKSKSRRRTDGNVNVVVQSPVVPDFLL